MALRDARRNREALFERRDAVLRVPAAGDQRTHVPADGGVHAGDDFSRHFEAGNVGRAGRRRVFAEPLHDVGAVDARRGHADENFTGVRLRHGPIDEVQHVRSTVSGDLDGAH